MFRENKKLSRARRWSRIAVWVTFGVVLTIRIMFPPERRVRVGPRQQVFAQNWQFRRQPARVYPPASEVPGDLWRIQIEIASADVNKLRDYYWDRWHGARNDRPEVLAKVREGGGVYTNVALHLKGAAGSFRPFVDKPALTLNFSKHAPNQQFHGYSKISLNNSVQDQSYLCEAISRELFLAAGVPVPRADHATVLINGRDLGLYVMTEGFGKTFLKRHFKNVKGNLYDGGFVQDINGNLKVNSGDHPDDPSDLNHLIEAATATNRWQRLNKVLDIDRFISFLAMEAITCHWDGYSRNKNNYRIFHDLETDRMVFMPHGLDQMFGWGRSQPTDSIEPENMQGLVARAVTATPEGRRLYFERIATLRTNVFQEDKVISRVRELSRRIRPTLAAYAPELAAEQDAQADYLCRRISDRARSLSEQLAAREPIHFDADGVARLSGWTRGVTFQRMGFPFGRDFGRDVRGAFRRESMDGKTVLPVTANRGGVSSWRTRVVLPAGRYRFEGRARTSGVGDTGGVCLRISEIPASPVKPSDDAWTTLRFNLVLKEPLTEAEFVCELRAAQGEAWFDEESLRLIRE